MDSIRITPESLDVAAAVHAVICPEAGGIDVFLGTTRAEHHPQFGPLLLLDYEAYEPMASAQIARILTRARDRWPIARAVIWHRIGQVPVGSPSVVIAVSCPHRAASFDACRFLIDELKQSVPIWKKEIYERSARWSAPPLPKDNPPASHES